MLHVLVLVSQLSPHGVVWTVFMLNCVSSMLLWHMGLMCLGSLAFPGLPGFCYQVMSAAFSIMCLVVHCALRRRVLFWVVLCLQ